MIEPVGDKILITFEEESSLIMPNGAKSMQQGTVLDVGEDKEKKLPSSVKNGATVYFSRYSLEGNEFIIDGKKIAFVKFDDILGVNNAE